MQRISPSKGPQHCRTGKPAPMVFRRCADNCPWSEPNVLAQRIIPLSSIPQGNGALESYEPAPCLSPHTGQGGWDSAHRNGRGTREGCTRPRASPFWVGNSSLPVQLGGLCPGSSLVNNPALLCTAGMGGEATGEGALGQGLDPSLKSLYLKPFIYVWYHY